LVLEQCLDQLVHQQLVLQLEEQQQEQEQEQEQERHMNRHMNYHMLEEEHHELKQLVGVQLLQPARLLLGELLLHPLVD
jgi:hypothetical protein